MTRRWIAIEKKGKLVATQVEATLVPGIPGVFISEDPRKKGRYAITHRGTGLRVGTYLFRNRKAAKTVVIQLTKAMGIDWTIKDGKVLLNSFPGIDKRMTKIIKDNQISVERGPV